MGWIRGQCQSRVCKIKNCETVSKYIFRWIEGVLQQPTALVTVGFRSSEAQIWKKEVKNKSQN